MSQGVWKCDSCDSNNAAERAVCQLCGRPPGSVTCEVPIVTHEPLADRGQGPQRQQPTFVPSAHERPTVTLTPPARPTPPPRPPLPSESPNHGGAALALRFLRSQPVLFGPAVQLKK